MPWLAEPDDEGHSFAADDPRHGSTNGYLNHRCRCVRCRAAWADWHLRYMHANPEQQERSRARNRAAYAARIGGR